MSMSREDDLIARLCTTHQFGQLRLGFRNGNTHRILRDILVQYSLDIGPIQPGVQPFIHPSVSARAITTSSGKSTSAHLRPSIDTVPTTPDGASAWIALRYQLRTPSEVRIIVSTWRRKIAGPSPL